MSNDRFGLNRQYIGFDINETIVNNILKSTPKDPQSSFRINLCDICNEDKVQAALSYSLSDLGSNNVDLIISHPPYLDIITFTEHDCDLSHIEDLSTFTKQYVKAVGNVWQSLKKGGHFILVVGDVYKKSEVIPLGFSLMSAIRSNFKCLLKGIIVKDIVGNRGKIGQDALWKYRAMKWGTYIFKHEYIFVFKKK